MSESLKKISESTLKYLPIIVLVGGGIWGLVAIWGESYVAGIAEQVCEEKVKEADNIEDIHTEVVAIKGTLSTLEGNDEEIRNELGNTVKRLDTIIEILLRE